MDDKRQFKRIPEYISIKYKIITLGSQPDKTIGSSGGSTSENISKGGILILADEKIPLGSFLEFEINLVGEQFPVFLKGRVVRVEEVIPEKKYDLGIMFSSIFDTDKKILFDHVDKMENKYREL